MHRLHAYSLHALAVIVVLLLVGCASSGTEPPQAGRADPTAPAVTSAPTASHLATGVPGSPTPAPATASPVMATRTATVTAAEPSPTREATPIVTATELPTPQPSPSPLRPATAAVAATASHSQAPTPMVAATKPVRAVTPAEDEALIATGLQVYRDQYCGICHQLGAAGTRGTFGPTHDGLGLVAESRLGNQGYGGAATSAAEYIRESIVDPKAFIVPGYGITSHPMPAYDFLSEDEILALVAMLRAQE